MRGLENIICLFNKALGKPEQLPFDLRFRSPMQYEVTVEGPKAAERNALSNALQKALKEIIGKQHSRDIIYNNIKLQVDQHLMAIANNSYKLFYGYKSFITPHDLFALLDLNNDEFLKLIKGKEFLGFQLFRDTEKLQISFQAIIDNPIFAKHIDDGKVASLITLINALYLFNENIKNRRDLFKKTTKVASEFRVVNGHSMNNANPPNSVMLIKKIDDEKGVVMDAGEFPKYRQDNLLHYFMVSDKEVSVLVLLYEDIFRAIEEVIKNWDGSITLDPSMI
jgi:hypothetical protein